MQVNGEREREQETNTERLKETDRERKDATEFESSIPPSLLSYESLSRRFCQNA